MNKGHLMPFPTMTRGLLGHFPRGVETTHVTPARPVTDTFVLTSYIGGQGQGQGRRSVRWHRRDIGYRMRAEVGGGGQGRAP